MAYNFTSERAMAMEDAAQCGGKFLDGLGKTDLSLLSYDEFMAFISTVCNEYDESYDRREEARENAAKANVERWEPPPPLHKSAFPSLEIQLRGANYDDDEIPF